VQARSIERAIAWFAECGVTFEAVLSDNGPGYIGHAWRDLCADHHIDARRIRAYTPRTKGKVERFNRTLQAEGAYVRPYRSNGQGSQHSLGNLARVRSAVASSSARLCRRAWAQWSGSGRLALGGPSAGADDQAVREQGGD
jgi:transposase InsO family protein